MNELLAVLLMGAAVLAVAGMCVIYYRSVKSRFDPDEYGEVDEWLSIPNLEASAGRPSVSDEFFEFLQEKSDSDVQEMVEDLFAEEECDFNIRCHRNITAPSSFTTPK